MNELFKKYDNLIIGNGESEEIWKWKDKYEVYEFCKHRLENLKHEWEQLHISFLAAAACRDIHRYEDSINYISMAFTAPELAQRKENFIDVLLYRLISLCHTHIATGRWQLTFCGVEIGALETFRVLDKFFPDHPDVGHIRNRLKSLNVLKDEPRVPSGVKPSDICVVTSYDDKYAPIGDVCAKTLVKYCEMHGYSGRVIRNFVSGRHPMWDKIAIINNLLAEGVPYVFWVDADAMFVRYGQGIADEIDDRHDIFLTSGWAAFHSGPGDMIFRESANSGIMLIKNTEWSRKFIADIWNQRDFIDAPLADNAAMLHIMGYDSFMGLSEKNTPDYELVRHMKFLDFNWNSHPTGCMGNDPIILHYAGVNFAARVRDMNLQLERTFPR